MNLLLPVLRASYCRSTHHHFALDALPLVQTDAGRRLVRWLLRYHNQYLTGATDPDTRFRDYQNHVIHVDDGYWGGAPRVAHQWYDRLQRYLRQQRFADAAHAAGVLSHYFTDPIQPLHTAQSDRETVVHRPLEWSINMSYHAIYRRWIEDDMRVVFQLSDGPGWLGEAILHGARFANRKYQRLIDSCHLEQCVNDPRNALDAESRSMLAELFGLSITGWARILERAAMDAEAVRRAPLPPTALAGATLAAVARAPHRLWLRWIERVEEQLAVSDLYDEFRRTGSVKNHLPAEVDILQRVRKVYHDERRWREDRRLRLQSKATVIDVKTREDEPRDSEMPATIPFVPLDPNRGRLSDHDPLIDAPSIGPKTAARFSEVGVETVGEFLSSGPKEIARRLATYWISEETVAQWQAQAVLMCEVPKLKPREAQLLAGAGRTSAAQLASSDPTELHRDVSRFAMTTTGRRYLRGADPPNLRTVQAWIANARNRSQSDSPIRRSA